MIDRLAPLRTVKHRLFVHYKRVRWPLYEATEPLVRAWHRRFPVRVRMDDFEETFLSYDHPMVPSLGCVPRVIYCFWTGDNDIPQRRLESLAQLQEVNPEAQVTLVTPDNLNDYVLDGHPLHRAYEGLAFVHRADYLRCYFLNFHGGGYADIKPFAHSWSRAFQRLDTSEAWMIGYRNPSRLMTPNLADRRMERLMVRTSDIRLGQSAYVVRPQTPITEEWWREVNRRITAVQEQLDRESPGPARHDTLPRSYPLHWNGLLAQILDPLTVKYRSHLLYDPALMYDLSQPYL